MVRPMAESEERLAFPDLARREMAGLYSLARRLAGDDAEDLVQECLLRACRAYGSLDEPAAARRWLRTILLNLWRDGIRRRDRQPAEIAVEDVDDFSLFRTIAEQDPLPYSDSVHLDFLRAFGAEDVRGVLLRLPHHYRAPLVLRYFEGFATKEIARLLDLPLGTVLAQLHRGRKLFEREMWVYAREKRLLERQGVR